MEKRKDKRQNEENKAVIKLVEGKADSANKISINALTQNISLSGVRVQSDKSFPVDTNVNLQLTLSRSKKILKLNGKVKWVKDVEDGELYEMGVEFIEALPYKIIVLLQHLFGSNDK